MSDINMYSLEEDEGNEIFITQESRSQENEDSIVRNGDSEFEEFCGGVGQGACGVSNQDLPNYSDISEDEDFLPNETKWRFDSDDKIDDGSLVECDSKDNVMGRGVSRMIGLHSRKLYRSKSTHGGVSKAVSRKFLKVSDVKLQQLQTKTIKKRTESKMLWAVRAFKEWRLRCLEDVMNFDKIFECNLDDVASLTCECFECLMVRFLPEVVKVKDGSDYPGATLYQMVVALQMYVNDNGKNWKLVEGPDFQQIRVVLDNLMKERVSQNIGMIKKQANVITLDFEETLWLKGILREDTPDKLRSTVLFLLGISLGLRAGDEHYFLHRPSPDLESQITFQYNENGVRCLVYKEDTVTKTNDGGLNQFRKDRKVVWVYPSKSISMCTVRLVDKYIGLCPPVCKGSGKANFYLQSLNRVTPAQWYSSRVLGINSIKKVVGQMLKDANLDGYFTNHSLRRSSTTRLFQAGIDHKLVKEFTGYASDAVDKYQITSDAQCEAMSNIIAGKGACVDMKFNDKKEKEISSPDPPPPPPPPPASIEISVCDKSRVNCIGCQCKLDNVNLSETSSIGTLLQDLLQGRRYGKAVIKIEVDLKQ